MRKLFLSTAIGAALLAGAAAAQSVNPGVEQLARIAGVSAEGFTQAQLVRLIDAQRDNDQEEVNFILSQNGVASRADTTGAISTSQGADQLSALAGVEPGQFTNAELTRLIEAKRTNDDETVAFILSGANRETRGGIGEASQGKAQLAASLGVNPADYTLAELSTLYLDSIDN
jgi:hypothetical protein